MSVISQLIQEIDELLCEGLAPSEVAKMTSAPLEWVTQVAEQGGDYSEQHYDEDYQP